MGSDKCQVEMLLLVESGHFWESVQGQCFLQWNLEHSGVRHTKHSACRGSICDGGCVASRRGLTYGVVSRLGVIRYWPWASGVMSGVT